MTSTEGRSLTCFCYWDGERQVTSNGTFHYTGGVAKPVIIDENINYNELVQKLCCCLNISPYDKLFYYNTKRDKTKYLRLEDQNGIDMIFYLNEDEVDIFVEDAVRVSTDPRFISSRESNLLESTHSGNSSVMPSSSQLTNSINNQMGLVPFSDEGLNELLTGAGQYFDSPEQFKQSVTIFATIHKFPFKYLDNSRAYYRIICTVDGCNWKLTARCEGDTDIVRVIRFIKEHKHTAQDVAIYKPEIRTRQLGRLFKDKVMDKPSFLPRDICREFEAAFSVQLSYNQAWRVKEHAKEAITGLSSMVYNLVPWMCERLVESIPNTRAIWTCTEDGKFKQLFVAYGCSIMGFMTSCRPLLFIDACFLTGPYRGHLFSATAHDADDGLYPLAYAVVSSENDEDWLWFLQNIKDIIGDREVVLMTDRNSSLLNGIIHVFGGQCNAWCLRHLKENFSKFANSKGVKGNKKQTALKIVDKMAYARTERLYQIYLTKLYAINSDLGNWVEGNGHSHWANAFFPYRRWDKLYTNLAECFNSWILPERNLDIIELMKGHVRRTTELLLRKHDKIQSWKLPVGPNIEKLIKESQRQSNGFTHRPTSETEYVVHDADRKTFAVKLNPPHCSCLEWQMTGIPCPHVCCAIEGSGLSVYDLIEPVLTKKQQLVIYGFLMSPVPLHDMPTSSAIIVSDGFPSTSVTPPIVGTPLLPPSTKRSAGRPKKKRIESQRQEKNTVYCSRCHEPGHNRSTCKSALPG